MHRRGARHHDQRRLRMLAVVFFAVGVIDLVVAIEMRSRWMVVATALCGIAGAGVLLASRCKQQIPTRG